eukprot:838008-Pyramimonas_sp.AAC.1
MPRCRRFSVCRHAGGHGYPGNCGKIRHRASAGLSCGDPRRNAPNDTTGGSSRSQGPECRVTYCAFLQA